MNGTSKGCGIQPLKSLMCQAFLLVVFQSIDVEFWGMSCEFLGKLIEFLMCFRGIHELLNDNHPFKFSLFPYFLISKKWSLLTTLYSTFGFSRIAFRIVFFTTVSENAPKIPVSEYSLQTLGIEDLFIFWNEIRSANCVHGHSASYDKNSSYDFQ